MTTEMRVLLAAAILVSASAGTRASAAERPGVISTPPAEAGQILALSGVQGGLIVHFGCTDGRLTAALRAGESYLVHGLAPDATSADKARQHIQSLGLYGNVTVEPWSGGRLPYAENLVNLLVAEDLHSLPQEEVVRVLVPNGVACIRRDGKWTRIVKPRAPAIDDWTHALYDASNNAVSRDRVVGPPRHFQWLAEPQNARHHETLASVSAVVSAGGRLFSIVDEAPVASVLLPPQWRLVARDAFNGVLLWKRDITTWHPHLAPAQNGPPGLSRRLVAHGNRVYVTLGLAAPLTALDAATGQTVATYTGTEATEEILFHDGLLYLVVGGPAVEDRSPRSQAIVAIEADSGRLLWSRAGVRPLPMSLAVGGDRVFWMAPDGILCVDARSGADVWYAERKAASQRPQWSAPTLVVQGEVVLCADRRPTPVPDVDESTGKPIPRWLAEGAGVGDVVAYSAQTGKTLWTAKCAETYHSPIDVLVNDGLVWLSQSRAGNGPDFTAALDLLTGQIGRRISSERAFRTTMPHHRCYRDRATSRYLITGRTGVEFIDLQTGEAARHHWVRGSCQYGVIPANGLLYAPQHSCACYIEAKLTGLLALKPAEPADHPGVEPTVESEPSRRVSGSAVAESNISSAPQVTPDDWPTYRHDSARSGHTLTEVPVELKCAWQARIGGRLSAPVIADDRLLVASVETHTVYAFDASGGKQLWQYTAGGRIDSPPTIARGLAVFGSADGWVHCLRATDGQLVWRYRLAPKERRVVAFGQLESTWPVHGSVLVRDDVVYCVAGRSSYLDGGIRLDRLDLKTGRKLTEQQLLSREPRTGEQPEEPRMFEMPGALPDVLSSDGQFVYMRHLGFDPQDLAPRKAPAHLYSPAGFLDDTWWHRTYWLFGEHFYSGYIGWYFAGRETPAGRLLVMDDRLICGFGYRPEFYRTATEQRYHLFAMDRQSVLRQPPADYARANRDYPSNGAMKSRMPLKWSRDVPLLGRAMVLAGKTLFVAGPPARALRSRTASEGIQGAVLCAVSPEDGKTLAEYRLEAAPVFDGLAAARGRLYLALQDGRLLCLGDGRSPGGIELPRLATARKPATGVAVEPGLVGHWTLDDGAGEVATDSSGFGNDAEVLGRWGTGHFGTCVFTGGIPGAVTIKDGPLLRFGTSDFSMSFWVKPDAWNCRLLGKEDFPKCWWVVNLLESGRAELVLGAGREAGQMVRPTTSAVLSTKDWTHLTFVVDRRAAEVRWFVNGSPDSKTAIPAALTGKLDVEGHDLLIPSSHKPFTGLVDEVRLYRRALTTDETAVSYRRERERRASTVFRYCE